MLERLLAIHVHLGSKGFFDIQEYRSRREIIVKV
jgi:hypothetical protein